jgi:hypothetical protein
MNFKAFLLLGTSVLAALLPKEQGSYALTELLEAPNNQDSNIDPTLSVQQVNCKAAKEIIIMADLSGLADSGWANYVMPSVLKLVRSFDVSTTAARFEIFSRSATGYSGYWCINVELFSSANANINSLVSTIQAMPCNVLSPIGLATLVGVLYGSRRANTPVEILVLTDWLHHDAGLELFDADRIKAMGGVRFVCAGVGSGVDYGYLGSLCSNNIIKITNYAGIINSVDQIAGNLCNGINTPTIPVPTAVPNIAPSAKVTNSPTANLPTIAPSPLLTFHPTKAPLTTKSPTKYPTKRPTKYPTKYPTKAAPTTKNPTAKRFRNLAP